VAIDRRAARVLLIADGAVLLIKGIDPARPERGTWWHTPSGGIDEGEAIEHAAAREVFEETQHRVSTDDLGPVVATRVTTFEFDDVEYRQHEWFFAVTVPAFEPASHGWEEIEQRSLLAYRWWTVPDLRAADEIVFPADLPLLLDAVLAGSIDAPMVLSGD
jgi:8-oxo-dGTP pyrophosphatase MutT (NUDIX family)